MAASPYRPGKTSKKPAGSWNSQNSTHSSRVSSAGWICARTDSAEQLQRFAQHPKLVGVRHVVHDEPDDHFMLRPDFRRGIAQLLDFNLTYDLLLFPKHLKVAAQLVKEFPQQPFVLDHIAKPKIAERLLSPWKEDLHQLATFPNVFCKLSGMVTETNWKQWQPADFHPYLDVVLEAFGPTRLMIGSDWPVCTLSGDYESVMNIVIELHFQRIKSRNSGGQLRSLLPDPS